MITQDKLKKLYTYDEDSGIFTRNEDRGKYKAGGIAGAVNSSGYIVIMINSKSYQAHRLAWLYTHGEMPNGDIDHLNHIRTDNRLCNIREVNRSENGRNKVITNRNKSGFHGVYWRKDDNRWTAKIGVDGKQVYLGCFSEFHEAVNARKNAEVLYGFHKNHGKNKGEI